MKFILSVTMLSLVLLSTGCSTGEAQQTTSEQTNPAQNEADTQKDQEVEETTEETVEESNMPSKIVFAESGRDDESLSRYDAFVDVLEELLEVEIEYYSLSDRLIGTEALIAEHIDILFTGPSEYVQLSREIDVHLLGGFERKNYTSALIINKEYAEQNNIESIEDIKNVEGRVTVGMKDLGSTSGHVGPSALLVDAGLDLETDVLVLTEESTGDRFAYLYEENDSYILGTGIKDWETVQEEYPDKYMLLAEGEPLPADVFLAGPHVEQAFVDKFNEVFMENQEIILEAMLADEKNDKYEGARMVDAKDEDYELVREAYDKLGL